MLETPKVLLAEDHPVVRRGLRVAIEEDPECVVVGEASDGAAALALIGRLRPDVAVLDIDMRNLDGFEVARSMKRQEIKAGIIFRRCMPTKTCSVRRWRWERRATS